MQNRTIGGPVGLAIGVILTIFYFSLAHFFAVNARMSGTNTKNQRVAENANANTQDVTVTELKDLRCEKVFRSTLDSPPPVQ